MSLLGIDIGTTRVKVVVISERDTQVLRASAAATPVTTTPLGDMRDPSELLTVVAGLLDEVLADGSLGVRAIAVASVGEEMVLIGEDGLPVTDSFTWFNPTGNEAALHFLSDHDGAYPGVSAPHPSFTLFKLQWMANNNPAALAATATFTDMGSYVAGWLSGGDADRWTMDYTHCCRTGMFDVREREWHPPTVEAAGVGLDQLPRLVPSGTLVGQLSESLQRRWHLGPIAIASGAHDHLCAGVAVDATQAGDLFLSAGTSEAQLLITDALPAAKSLCGIDVGCYVDSGLYYLHANVLAGRLYQHWRSLLMPGLSDDEVDAQLAHCTPDSSGLRVRLSEDNRTLDLLAVPDTADRADIMAALLAALAQAGADATDALARASGSDLARVIAAGIPTRHMLWRAMRERAMRRPMTYSNIEEPTAVGAALLAGRAL